MAHSPHTPPQDVARGSGPAPSSSVANQQGNLKKYWLVALICWLLVIADGYDLMVFGAVKPTLIEEWGMSQSTAGTLGSAAFVGMFIGSILAGRISDALGRKTAVLLCATVFALPTLACAFAHGPVFFGLMRLIAGMGLGGLIPSASAVAAEISPPRWRSALATLMFSGVPLGGITASLLGIPVIPGSAAGLEGWRWMFLILVILSCLLIPIAYFLIPASLNKVKDAATPADASSGFSALFGKNYRVYTCLFGAAALAVLVAWFGMGTELPNLMKLRGANLGSALTFALVLNLGAVAGSVITAWSGDKFGPVLTAAVGSLGSALGLFVIMLADPSKTGLIYAMLVLAGIGTHGTLALIISAVTLVYSRQFQGTALGLTLGIGRIGAIAAPQAAGLILSSYETPALGVNTVFTMFALAALATSLLLFVLAGLLGKKLRSF